MRYAKARCRLRKKTSKEFYSFAICIVFRGEYSMPLRAAQGKDLDSSITWQEEEKERAEQDS